MKNAAGVSDQLSRSPVFRLACYVTRFQKFFTSCAKEPLSAANPAAFFTRPTYPARAAANRQP